MTKRCSDCKFLVTLINSDRICSLKSIGEYNPVLKAVSYYYKHATLTTHVIDERVDSKGFFGLFRDKTRCGSDAINFESKDNAK